MPTEGTNKNEEPRVFFWQCDLLSCPKCFEAKVLGNKYYNQLWNISDRIYEYAMNCTPETYNERKMNGLFEKYNKTQTEFLGILRGRVKCGCIPQWMLDIFI